MSARGAVSKRCGCTEIVDGRRRQLGQRCSKLRRKNGTWSSDHGTWLFTVTVPGKGGKPQQIRRAGYATSDEAQDALDAIRDKARRGVVVTDLTLGEFLTSWLAGKVDIARGTRRSYEGHIRNYHVPHLGHLRIEDVRVAHVAEMLAEVHASDATRQRVRATLRSALNDAVRESLLFVNPAALVKLPSGKRPKALVWTAERVEKWQRANERLFAAEPDSPEREQLELAAQPPSAVMVWTPSQLGRFLDVAQSDRLYALWHLVAHRGLRRGEACGVEWQDIDLGTGMLTVCRQLVQDGWDVVETKPKSEAGNRSVALDAGTVAALQAHRRAQMEDRLAWGPAWGETGKVFVREDGSTLHPAMVTGRFYAMVEETGLPPIRLHDLRHGAASLMLAAGVPMKVVQETLGHSSSAITADTYTSVFPTVAAEAAEAAAALVPRQATGTETHTSRTHRASAGSKEVGNAWSDGGPPGARTRNLRIKSSRESVPDEFA